MQKTKALYLSAVMALGVLATAAFAQEKPVAGEVKEGSLKGKTLTFVSYGGIYQDGQVAAMKEFVDKTGVTLLNDGPTEIAKLQAQVESGNVTDRLESNVVAVYLFQLAFENALEHRHEAGDFRFGTLPVLGREGVERDGFDLKTRTRVDDRLNRFRPGTMPEDTRLGPLLCPAAIAVHYHGNVVGYALRVDRGKQLCLGRVRFYDARKIFVH